MYRVILLLFVLILFALPVGFWWFAHSSLPQYEGIARHSSLFKEVEVLSDWRDVPYIKALSEPDMYRAQGYWTATRRLFQLDMLRRISSGTLSEVYGSRCLAQDKLIRQLGFRRLAQKELKSMSTEARKCLEDYSAGINGYLDSNEYKNPLECSLLFYKPRKWTPADTICLMKYLEYLTNESWSLDDLRQKVVDKAGADVATELFGQKLVKSAFLEDDLERIRLACGGERGLVSDTVKSIAQGLKLGLLSPPGYGSNGWVVSGDRTDSKGGILAFDRHSNFMDPNLWYVISLSCPKLKLSGVTIPGVPGILFGRNSQIAWGATAYKVDDQDLYVEQFSEEFPDKYKTKDGWDLVDTTIEEIPCRDVLGFSKDVYRYKVQVTSHGPILLSSGNSAVSLKWIGENQKLPSFEAYYKIARATDWAEFRNALKDYDGTAQTFLFVDREGGVGLQVAGAIPERLTSSLSTTYKAGQLLPGWTGQADWRGNATFDSLPSFFKPQEGFLVASSKLYQGESLESSPYPVSRITSALEGYVNASRKVGLPDMANLQGDEFAAIHNLFKETIMAAVAKNEVVDSYQVSFVKRLESWNGELSSDSYIASVYEAFLRNLARRMLVPKIEDALTRQYMSRWPRWTVFVERFLREKDENWLPPEERTFETFIITTLSQSIADVRLASESEDIIDWKWGKIHTATFENIIFHGLGGFSNSLGWLVNPPVTGVGGDGDTVSACNLSEYVSREKFTSSVGPTTRVLIDMSDSDKYYETQPMGQGGHLFSEYRTDQLDSWLKKKPLLVPCSDKEAMRQQRNKMVLTP